MSSRTPLPPGVPFGDVDGAWPSPHAAMRPRRWQVAISAAIFLALLADVYFDGAVRSLDHHVADGLLSLDIRDHPVLRHLGFVLSQAGGRATNLVWILLLCVIIAVRERTLAPFAKVLSALAVMIAAVYPFKEWLSRSFPADPRGDYLHAPGALGGAFPSGHQANATLLVGVGAWIAMEYLRERPVRSVVAGYAMLAPIIAAVGVLAMGYHWLSDVIAGTCAGVVLLAVVRWAWTTPWGLRVQQWLALPAR